MLKVIHAGFGQLSQAEINIFITKILDLAEFYLKFLINKNKFYLPDFHSERDAAVDLLADVLIIKDNTFIKFRDFFKNSVNASEIKSDEEAENLVRAYIYSIIQNNITALFKNYDPASYNIIRNIKESVKDLSYHISQHFSDKYIHISSKPDFNDKSPERDNLMTLIYAAHLNTQIYNVKNFLEQLFIVLSKKYGKNCCIKLSDLTFCVKAIFNSEFLHREGEEFLIDSISEKVNIKLILEDVKLHFSEKFEKYVLKNNLSKNFAQCMYSVIDEVVKDLNEGNARQSVLDLTKLHFNSCDKNIFYKVQYCLEIFERELALRAEQELLKNSGVLKEI